MERPKVWAIVAALAMAGAAAVALAGSATASEWHTYKGDVFAGHAYGIDVPEKANNVEFLFEGSEGGSAALGVYSPEGDKVGYYKLAPGMLAAASVANPAAGRFVVYVYDITDGALSVRVNSEDAPSKLELEAIELVREETTIGTFQQGRLDQVITAKLDAPTVFVTLLYEGSAKDLDATVSSPKGPVVTILDESATAFSPGAWTSLKGERSFNAANLDGQTYDVEIHAAQFEGTMTLTTLGLPVDAPASAGFLPMPVTGPGSPPSHPAHPGHSHGDATFRSSSAQFGLEEGVPVAFMASAGTLELADPAALDEDGDSDASYDDDCAPLHGLVAIYDPDDNLVALVELSHETPTASVELPVSGEYVAYARHVEGDVILAKLSGSMVAPALRALELDEEIVVIAAKEGASEIDLVNAPIELNLRYAGGIGALSNVALSNEIGLVASIDALVVAPGADFLAWTRVMPENFAKGTHTIETSGLYDGGLQLVSTYYVRASDAGAVIAPEPVKEPEDPEDPEEPSTPFPPLPPAPPFTDALVSAILG